jgi:hypothetical protein
MLKTSDWMLSIALFASAAAATAQEFPDGSTTPTATDLKQLIAGKVFSVQTSKNTWRLQINDNGYFFLNVGNYSDSGPWTVEDGKWCTKPQKSNASCNDMRLAGGSLYMKRDNGEIVQFAPQ